MIVLLCVDFSFLLSALFFCQLFLLSIHIDRVVDSYFFMHKNFLVFYADYIFTIFCVIFIFRESAVVY